MESREFAIIRKKLNKTQREVAAILGTSLKAVHSYEQGWRNIPPHAERQMFFLLSRTVSRKKSRTPCWDVKKCPPEWRRRCPAREFNAGECCWFINGTFCQGAEQSDWKEKMTICRTCDIFRGVLG